MINSSVNTASGPDHPALIIDGTGYGSSTGKRSGRTLSLLSTASDNYSRIPGQDARDSNRIGKTDSTVTGKSLEKRTLSALNQLAAGASAMAGSAWVRGISLYHPANLAMSLIQQVPGMVGTVCPDCPRLINAARSAADWGQAYGWANSIYAAMATGNIPAAATTTALCGASYACQNFSSKSVNQLCARFPASLREYGEPWLQAATRVAVAGALRVAETVGTSETVNSETVKKEGRRFIIPAHIPAQQDTTHPATEEPTPSVTVNPWNSPGTPHRALGTNATENALPSCSENSVSADFSSLPVLSAQAESTAHIPINKSPPVILPANHTGHGLDSLMSADSLNNHSRHNNPIHNNVVQPLYLEHKRALGHFLQFPLAEAGLIRSFTREQQKGLLQEAAQQHLMLAPHCPDMASATPVDNNGTVYRAESDTSGWVTIAHNQSFHYQLYSTDPVTPLAANLADGNRIPAPDILRLAHAIQDRIALQIESLPPVAELAKNIAADPLSKASAHSLTFAQPKVQSQLDPGMLSREVKNGTVLILKPCHFITGQPEASVLVLSADHQALNVETHIGTEGFVAERSLRAKRQASPVLPIRLAPDCDTEKGPGSVAGVLEVFDNGRWGSICGHFSTSEASVACAQLGNYTGCAEIKTSGNDCSTLRDRTILLGDVRCNGNETSLQECDHGGLGAHSCSHNEVVAVRCEMPLTETQIIAGKVFFGLFCLLLGSMFIGVNVAFCRSCRKSVPGNNDSSTCQRIRNTVVTTITKPCNLCQRIRNTVVTTITKPCNLCQYIRNTVATTITEPCCNLCRRRTNPLQPAANVVSASTDPSLHQDMPPPTYQDMPPPTYQDMPPPTYDEARALPYLHGSAGLDIESMEMARLSNLD